MNEWILLAVGQAEGGAAPGPGGFLGGLLPMIIIFAVFYFLIIRPQSKRQKEHRALLDQLKKGDQVVTNGGLIGTIWALDDRTLTLEVADKVKVRVLRGQVGGLWKDAASGDAGAKE